MLEVDAAILFVQPLVVDTLFWAVFAWSDLVTRETILFACMPLFLSYVVFFGRHKVADVRVSAGVFSTLFGTGTVTLTLGRLF